MIAELQRRGNHPDGFTALAHTEDGDIAIAENPLVPPI